LRIELGEIESALLAVAGVSASVVVAREDAPGQKRLVAYVAGSAVPTVAELREALKAKLPDYMVPSAFVTLDALPLTPNGKVDRKALPAPGATVAPSYLAPRTGAEEVLASIWSDVLGIEAIGRNDHFFEIGGHSLLATQVVSRIRATFGVDLALKTLFEAATVAELTQAIAAAQASGETAAPPLVAETRPDTLPLSFAQQRLWFLDQLEPGSAAYNIPAALRIRGRLDVEALRRTIETMVERHEALRTTFVSDGGEPLQEIHAPTAWALPCVDLDAGADLQARVQAEAAQPFNLATGPLLRT